MNVAKNFKCFWCVRERHRYFTIRSDRKKLFVVWVKKVKSKWNYYLMKRKIDWWQTFEFMIKRKSIEYAYS